VIDITTMTDAPIVVGTDDCRTISNGRGRASLCSWPFLVLVLIRETNAAPAKQTTFCLFSDSSCEGLCCTNQNEEARML
jgi:hypothetical protein